MPRVIVTEGAIEGLERCRQHLGRRSPDSARRAAQVIARQFMLLETQPTIGRPASGSPLDLRELIIPFGDTGYVALYRHDPADDAVYVIAFRHQREAGF